MVREEAHANGVCVSSIALLQERFRQLQRMKELRQERELKRSLSEARPQNPTNRGSATHSHRASPPPAPALPHCQLALSLWPRTESWTPSDLAKPFHSPSCHFPQFMNLENSDTDIDTSLRL